MKSARKELFLYLGPEAPEKVYWAEKSAYGAVVTGQGPLNEAPLQGEKVVVFVPGQDVLLTAVAVPGNRGRIVKKSLPYALEENLAEDIESLHFAHGPVDKTGEVTVAVAARENMDFWLAMLKEYGIEAKFIIPATLSVPVEPEQWSLFVGDDLFLLRKDHWHGLAGDLENISLLLNVGEEDDERKPVRLFISEECSSNCEEALAGMEFATTQKAPFLEVLTDGYSEKTTINLLQGDYSRHAGWREMWQKWRTPALVLLAIVLMNIAGFSVDYYQVRTENAELEKRIEALYLKTFPDSRRIVNPRAQMEQKLSELEKAGGDENSFFEVYDQIAPILLDSTGFNLNNLRYNNGRFDFDFEIENLQTLEKLKSDLAGIPDIEIDIKNAESVGNKVKTKIQIKGR